MSYTKNNFRQTITLASIEELKEMLEQIEQKLIKAGNMSDKGQNPYSKGKWQTNVKLAKYQRNLIKQKIKEKESVS
jgi:hypothetical protein